MLILCMVCYISIQFRANIIYYSVHAIKLSFNYEKNEILTEPWNSFYWLFETEQYL